MRPIRTVIVDDHRVVSRSLTAFFELFADIKVAGVCGSGEEFLGRQAEWQPDVVVMDLLLPGGIDGIETMARARNSGFDGRFVVLTASVDEVRRNAAIRAGATGYVRKNAEPELLLHAIREVAAGRTFIDTPAPRTTSFLEELSPREREVLGQLARGMANKEIAATLFISEETVKTHVSRLIAKLGADNRADAIVQALRRGVLILDELD